MARFVALSFTLLLACVGGADPVPQTLRIPIRGLHTSPNEHGEVPPGSLVKADNIVISRQGDAEPRRGQKTAIVAGATSIIPYAGALVLHSGAVASYTDAAVTSKIDYPVSIYAPTGRRLRGAVANDNLYLAAADGVKRQDSISATPVPAGVPMGLDVQGVLTAGAGFLAADTQVGYRVVWGLRDANGNLLLSAPSGRAVVVNAAGGGTHDVTVSTSIPAGITSNHFWQLYRTAPSVSAATDPGDEMGLVYEGAAPATKAITQLVRTGGNTVTASALAHGYAVGQIVRVSPGASVGGVFCAVGDSASCSTSSDGATWAAQTISAGSYRAVAWNGTVFAAVGLTAAAATSPDGVTWTGRTIPAGTYKGIAFGASVFVAVGAGVAATSPDGTTWSARTIQATDPGTGSAITWQSVVWTGSQFVAVGTFGGSGSGVTTSPDGITWTYRSLGAFAGGLVSVVWTGSLLVAVGPGTICYTSPDAVTWTQRSPPGGIDFQAIAYSGSLLLAVGFGGQGATSTDGISWSAVTLPGGFNYKAVAWNGTVFVAAGATSGGSARAASSPDGSTWTQRTVTGSTLYGLATSGALFPAGEKIVTGTPSADTFTYAETGTNATLVSAQTATPLTAIVLDQIPSTFAGATLYTSQSQQGILASAYEPPAAKDITVFRETVFWANVSTKASLDFYVLATGSPSGIQAGDTITINGIVYTADASESIGARKFQVYTSGTPTQNVFNTSASLVRIINRAQGSTVYCRDLSGVNEQPGHLQLTGRTINDSITASVSRAASWAFVKGTSAAPETHADELRWAPTRQPDSAPVVNYKRFGGAIIRAVALRDSLFIITDGASGTSIWRLTGDGGNWTISPFDSCTDVIGPDTVVQMDNIIYALSTQGVVQISDTGVTIISQPIKDKIDLLLAEPLRSTVETVAHGAVNTAEGKYFLWIPTLYTDPVANNAWVYDQHQSLAQGEPTWTRRTDTAATAVINPADGKLYTASAVALTQERKALDYTDFADSEYAITLAIDGQQITVSGTTPAPGDAIVQGSVRAIVMYESDGNVDVDRSVTFVDGAATLYKAFPTTLEFAPIIPAPGGWARFSEMSMLFRYLSGAQMTMSCATEFTRAAAAQTGPLTDDSGYVDVVFYGTRDYGLVEDRLFPVNLRTWVPRDCQTASRLMVRFTHNQALSPMALEGLSIAYVPISVRLNR